MIDENDILFDYLTGAEERFSLDNILYIGWYGDGAYAFKQFADAYAFSADVVFNKFVEVGRDFAKKDSLAITLLFLYRHYCELIIKYLYFKYLGKSRRFENEEEFNSTVSAFFNKNQHSIVGLWQDTLPIISPLRKRVKAAVSIDGITSYFRQIDRFDSSSMMMRYPVKKDLSPMIEGHIKIDIVNFHEKMVNLIRELDKLDDEIDNQIVRDYPIEKMEACFQALKKHKQDYNSFLQLVTALQQANKEHKGSGSFRTILNPPPEIIRCRKDYLTHLNSLSDESFRLLEAMYYTGRSICSGEIHLPPKRDEAFLNTLTSLLSNVRQLGNGDCSLDTPYLAGERESCPFYQYREDCLLKHIECVLSVVEPYLGLDTIIEPHKIE